MWESPSVSGGTFRRGRKPQILRVVDADAAWVAFGHEFPHTVEAKFQMVGLIAAGLLGDHTVDEGGQLHERPSDDVIGICVVDVSGEQGPLYSIGSAVGEDEDPRVAPELEAQRVGCPRPHDMNPHVDLVFPHDARQNLIELAVAHLVLKRHRIIGQHGGGIHRFGVLRPWRRNQTHHTFTTACQQCQENETASGELREYAHGHARYQCGSGAVSKDGAGPRPTG